MTMKPNMELNSMMFFEAALEEQRSNLLSDMPLPSASAVKRQTRRLS